MQKRKSYYIYIILIYVLSPFCLFKNNSLNMLVFLQKSK